MTSRRLNLMRKFRGSKYLNSSNDTEIISNADFHFTLDERFKPYDDTTLTNSDTDNDCLLLINGTFKLPLPAGNSQKIEVPVSSVQVINIGSTTISVNNIRIFYRNTGFQGSDIQTRIIDGANILNVAKGLFR